VRKTNHHTILENLEHLLESSSKMLHLNTVFSSFSGPDIDLDGDFFEDEDELDEYMKDLHYDLQDGNSS